MNPRIDFFSFLNLFGALNGIFFAVVILNMKRGNAKTNRLAALLLASLTVIAAGSFCAYSGYFRIFPKLQKIFSPFLFALGPLLYFYVRSLLRSGRSTGRKWALHFLPVLLNVIYNIPFYLESDAVKIAGLSLGITPTVRVIRILALVQFLVYLFLSFREIREFRVQARERYASLSRMKVRWIVFLGLAIGTILLVNIVPDLPIPVLSPLGSFWEALVIVFLGYKGLTRPALFLDKDFWNPPARTDHALIPESRQQAYLDRILDFMSREKPYLDPELSLEILAGRLGMPPVYCSFLINRRLNVNFFRFVNGYRIDEFKQRLERTAASGTILEAAFESGFNSKSTFNAAFKEAEGVTPSQYLKALKASRRPTF